LTFSAFPFWHRAQGLGHRAGGSKRDNAECPKLSSNVGNHINFWERFLLPPEAEYAYVVATVHVAQQRLRVMLGTDLIAELPYPLR